MTTTINNLHHTGRRAGRPPTRHPTPAPDAPVDIYQCDDHYVVLGDLPGLDPGSLDVAVDGTIITIRGHRSAPHLPGATRVTGHRPYGHINHRIRLDQPASGHGITATYTERCAHPHHPTSNRSGRGCSST